MIIQNLHIHGATSDVDGDGMHIYYAHHVWIDHCEISGCPRRQPRHRARLELGHGVVDQVPLHQATRQTPEHRFSNLIGHHGDKENAGGDEDWERLKVTFHHNWWAQGVIERMPRVRFGQVHVFNNYYGAEGNNYAIGGGFQARLASRTTTSTTSKTRMCSMTWKQPRRSPRPATCTWA